MKVTLQRLDGTETELNYVSNKPPPKWAAESMHNAVRKGRELGAYVAFCETKPDKKTRGQAGTRDYWSHVFELEGESTYREYESAT